MRNLAGKRALITGAASGIGRALALGLAAERTHVYLLDIDEAGAQQVAESCRQHGVEAIAARCDVTKPEQITAAVQQSLATWPDIDLLVNNVGVAYYGPTENMTAEQWNWLMGINLLAPLQFTRELLPTLLSRPEAHILNMCSIAGLVAGGRFAAYHVSKFGLVGFTESLRAEYVRRGLGATAVCPGPVLTKLYQSAASGRADRRVPEPPAWASATPEQVARKAIRGIKRNSSVVLVTPMAHALAALKRLSPGFLDFVNTFGRRKKMKIAITAPAVQHEHVAAPALKIAVSTRYEAAVQPAVANHPADVERITFDSHGTPCEAWLMRPASSNHNTPLVLMGHGFAAEKSFGLKPYAEHFVQRGAAVMMFDYRHFGGSAGVPRNLVSCSKQRQDWQAAFDFSKTLPSVDAGRIALWGTSLSGGHVIECAARNSDVAAVIAQMPMLDVPGSVRHYKLRYGLKALAHGLYDLARSAVGMTPHYVPVVGENEKFAVLDKPGCDVGYRRFVPDHANWQNNCPARVLLTSLAHRPIRHAANVKCPTLLVIAECDQLIPATFVHEAAAKMADAKVITIAGDHFAPYYNGGFAADVAEQANFIEDCLINARTLPMQPREVQSNSSSKKAAA